jgi:hypothetical protein
MLKLCYPGLTLVASTVLLSLSACDLQGRDEMSWARAALERNGSIEVIATDQQSRTFTVRVKDSGELRVVRADQLIGAAPSSASASGTITAAAGATVPAITAAAPVTQPEPMPSALSAQGSPSEPNPSAMTPPGSLAPQTAASVESSPGRVLESGPGYTIKAADGAAAPARVRGRATGFTNAAIERRHEPIVCQGARLLHIDNRNLVFDGDAVSAEDGCEIHITNSHISAGGVGISARAANVHIDNSLIEGDQASIDASEGAQVYAGSSQFRGLSRRLDSATFHDLGGNVWN